MHRGAVVGDDIGQEGVSVGLWHIDQCLLGVDAEGLEVAHLTDEICRVALQEVSVAQAIGVLQQTVLHVFERCRQGDALQLCQRSQGGLAECIDRGVGQRREVLGRTIRPRW